MSELIHLKTEIIETTRTLWSCSLELRSSNYSHLFISCLCSPVPVFYFGEVEYHVDESDGYVEIKVWRTGTDLSKSAAVTVSSRKAEPVSAEGELPYS